MIMDPDEASEYDRLRAENERLREALIHTRTFLKTYHRSNAVWHNDRPTWDFVRTIIDPAIGDIEQKVPKSEFELPPLGPELDDATIASLQERALAPQSKGGL